MKRLAAVLLVVSLALVVAGCGSGDDESASGTTATSPGGEGGGESLQIGEKEWALDPSAPSVAKAGTVTIHVTNDGSFGHALEIEGNGIEEETETIAAGDSADLTVDLKAGTYEIYCPISDHRDKGMEGTLSVAGGAGSGGGTTTTDDDSDDDSGGYGYG